MFEWAFVGSVLRCTSSSGTHPAAEQYVETAAGDVFPSSRPNARRPIVSSIGSCDIHCVVCCCCYRQILDAKYGLKRWQIGEIASKIGQLYYHY